MKWFKHDSDANMDSKLQEILLDYGLEGYGLYWYCLEMIVNKIDVDNLTFELEHDARIIARNTGSTTKKISEMMLRFVELDLFQNSEGRVTCLKLLQRLDKSMTSNVKFRNMLTKAKESHDSVMIEPDLVMQDKITLQEITQDKKTLKESNKSSNDDDIKFLTAITNHWNEIMTTQPRINLLDKTKATQTRIKSVNKEKPKKKRAAFTKPSIQDAYDYFFEKTSDHNYSKTESEKWWYFYDSKDWVVGKTKMKNWKSSISGWINRNSNQPTQPRYASKQSVVIDNDNTDWMNTQSFSDTLEDL